MARDDRLSHLKWGDPPISHLQHKPCYVIKRLNEKLLMGIMTMKMFKATVAAIALTTMVGAPVLAQAAGRVTAASSEESEAEGSTGIIIGVVAAAAVIGGIIVIADDDEPNSP
ncbi:hypothetical protein [Blastomonas sp.]|uniref:hypothetical protein n=1 Tax=Blastomonas sp. TaxID=1909299 RepID=UPI00406A510C